MKSARSAPVRAAGDLVFFVAGGLIFACSVKLFAAPNHFAPGGLTGLSYRDQLSDGISDWYYGVPAEHPDLYLGDPRDRL